MGRYFPEEGNSKPLCQGRYHDHKRNDNTSAGWLTLRLARTQSTTGEKQDVESGRAGRNEVWSLEYENQKWKTELLQKSQNWNRALRTNTGKLVRPPIVKK